jgi:hypothetical protein
MFNSVEGSTIFVFLIGKMAVALYGMYVIFFLSAIVEHRNLSYICKYPISLF